MIQLFDPKPPHYAVVCVKTSLNKLSGNKLAKMKRADFEKIIAAFQAEGDLEAIEEFILE